MLFLNLKKTTTLISSIALIIISVTMSLKLVFAFFRDVLILLKLIQHPNVIVFDNLHLLLYSNQKMFTKE